MIISIDAGKAFDRSQYPIMIKALYKVERGHLKTIKVLYDKPTTNIIFNNEKLKTFPLRLGTRQDSHSHHFYSIKYWKS